MTVYAVTRYDDELQHHGIKGQKWYVRRYQNEDGSLTPAGRIRYGYGDGSTKRPTNAEGKKFNSFLTSDMQKETGKADKFLKSGFSAAKKENLKISKEDKKILKEDWRSVYKRDAITKTNHDRYLFFKDMNKARKDLEAELNQNRKLLVGMNHAGRCRDAASITTLAVLSTMDPLMLIPLAGYGGLTFINERSRNKTYKEFVEDAEMATADLERLARQIPYLDDDLCVKQEYLDKYEVYEKR